MRQLVFLFGIFSLLLLTSFCQERKDRTIERNLLTYIITCDGGSLEACQRNCATRYPNVTGENFPQVSSCNSN
ncbi:MAG: hypothetical protein MUF77_13820, partial [Leptospira sp.]|nr:hypothetical protein [Leptospira sp.]